MAAKEKKYPYNSVLFYNLACDIVEMLKARVTKDTVNLVCFTARMYKQKTCYQLRITKQSDGCMLAVETPGDGEDSQKRIDLIFAIVDGMLAQLTEVKK